MLTEANYLLINCMPIHQNMLLIHILNPQTYRPFRLNDQLAAHFMFFHQHMNAHTYILHEMWFYCIWSHIPSVGKKLLFNYYQEQVHLIMCLSLENKCVSATHESGNVHTVSLFLAIHSILCNYIQNYDLRQKNILTHSLTVALETLVGFWPHQPASSILFCCSLNWYLSLSFITWSFHLLLGLPTGLFPSIVLFHKFAIESSFFLKMWHKMYASFFSTTFGWNFFFLFCFCSD